MPDSWVMVEADAEAAVKALMFVTFRKVVS